MSPAVPAPRLSRADQRARTRSVLVEAARTSFLTNGYAGTSLDAIAESAGYSKGAVYANFKDKPTLCRAVLDDIHRSKMAPARAMTDRIEAGGFGAFADELADWLRDTLGDVEWTMLEFEFVVVARHDAELMGMVVELRREASAAVADMLRRLVAASGVALGAEGGSVIPDLDDLADLLLGAGIGLGVQRAVDPSVSVDPTIDIIRSALAFLGT